MHDDTELKKKRDIQHVRRGIFFMLLWGIFAAFNIQKLILGEGNWITGVALTLNIWLTIGYGSRLWKAADPDAR